MRGRLSQPLDGLWPPQLVEALEDEAGVVQEFIAVPHFGDCLLILLEFLK